jgi:hypothetical protein
MLFPASSGAQKKRALLSEMSGKAAGLRAFWQSVRAFSRPSGAGAMISCAPKRTGAGGVQSAPKARGLFAVCRFGEKEPKMGRQVCGRRS